MGQQIITKGAVGVTYRPLFAIAVGIVASLLVALVSALAASDGEGPGTGTHPSPSPPGREPMSAGRPELEPVVGSNFPDPEIVKAGDTYYAYATNDSGMNVPVATAQAPAGPWKRSGRDALPRLPAWAERGRTWAPDVSVRADGSYLLYFTADRKGPDGQCIGAAVAATPAGPFTPDEAGPLACQGGDTIDPAAFVDTDGVRYVLYKRADEGLFLQRTTPDGMRPYGEPVQILTKGADEPRLVEAPALVKRAGRYVLFYAAGVFYQSQYQTRYATATSITGPYTKAGGPLLSTEGYGERIVGPGGADVVHDGTDAHLVFHGITKFLGNDSVQRSMYVAQLGWAGAVPVVRGSPVRYEAEKGRVYGARVLSDVKDTSAGSVVGYIDNAQCLVEFEVLAPATGKYLLRVRYNNRTNRGKDPAEHALTINGGARPALRYPPDPSRQWQDITMEVDLRAGWNTIRVSHGKGFAELDYIEVA